VNNQLTDQANAVGDKSDGNTRSGKGTNASVAIEKVVSVETRMLSA